jgi:uncharacterized membrane protein
MLDAARRILLLVAVVAGITAAVSLVAGALLGAELERSLAIGFYIVGCFLIVLGFFAGLRGPLRPRGGDDGDERDAVGGLFGIGISSRGVRTATTEERADSLATAWLFLGIGAALIALGVLVDPQVGFL